MTKPARSRHRRWVALGVLAGACVALVSRAWIVPVAPKVGSGTATPPPSWPSPNGLLRNGGNAGVSSHWGSFRYAIISAWETADCARMKAVNPSLRCLVYKDMASTRSYPGAYDAARRRDAPLLPTGVGFGEASRHDAARPSDAWFLRDRAGARLEWASYPDHWYMDIGSVSYQRRWRSNVLRELEVGGWDGVFVDNTSSRPLYLNGRTLARYPDDASYRAATERFLTAVAPAVKALGRLFIGNLVEWGDQALFRSWARLGSGGFKEHWLPPDRCGTDWTHAIELQESTQRQGSRFLANSYGPLTHARAMRYLRASFLVAWDGGEGAQFYSSGGAPDPWSSEWTVDIGSPVEPFRVPVAGGWKRRYTNGIAIVNPSCRSHRRFDLGAAYRGPDGSLVSAVDLPPRTGMVLRSP
jgi:hypothetical protein